MSNKKGRFISIEGIEGAGKSTALEFIKNFLTAAGKECMLTREPGGTPLAEHIRSIILNPNFDEQIHPATELLLMFAGRSQHISEVILPALNQGTWVVSDRFIDATYAYQGGGRSVDQKFISTLDKLIVDGLYPELTLLLDISPQDGSQRVAQRSTKDRIEQEEQEFFNRVRQVYLERAQADSKRIKIIDASLSLQKVQEQIADQLRAFIEE